MTEAEWLEYADPRQMLAFVRRSGSGRKLRLFACACVRESHHLLPAPDTSLILRIVEVQERFADSLIPAERFPSDYDADWWASELDVEPHVAYRLRSCWITFYDATLLAELAASDGWEDTDDIQPWEVCAFLRDTFGNPFRRTSLDSGWRTAGLLALAQAAYDERPLLAGTLDPTRLAILADALEECGYTDAAILSHLRGPGPHVRGCWALDLILGRE